MYLAFTTLYFVRETVKTYKGLTRMGREARIKKENVYGMWCRDDVCVLLARLHYPWAYYIYDMVSYPEEALEAMEKWDEILCRDCRWLSRYALVLLEHDGLRVLVPLHG